jgi:hypothetical protein
MAKCDGPSVRVDLGPIEIQDLLTNQIGAGKRLLSLQSVDVIQGQSYHFQSDRAGYRRTDANVA